MWSKHVSLKYKKESNTPELEFELGSKRSGCSADSRVEQREQVRTGRDASRLEDVTHLDSLDTRRDGGKNRKKREQKLGKGAGRKWGIPGGERALNNKMTKMQCDRV